LSDPHQTASCPTSIAAALLTALSCLIAGCAGVYRTQLPSQLQARIVHESLIDCFAEGLRGPDGKDVYCETSAVTIHGSEMLLASDKPIPGASPVFRFEHKVGVPQPATRSYLMVSALMRAEKLEELALTPDGRFVLAITAFDRIDVSGAMDGYNTLLVWPVGEPQQARVARQTVRGGRTSSLSLREQLANHLGQPYFKLEGLTALPDKLLLGIRELGQKYDRFEYKMLILELPYEITTDGELLLGTTIKTALDFVPSEALGLVKGVGLSSLHYDRSSGALLMLTSFEEGDRLGAYLWCMNALRLTPATKPALMRQADGKPIQFVNKAEGMALVDADTLFVIHDDDRVLNGATQRKPHQAAYSIVRLRKDACLAY